MAILGDIRAIYFPYCLEKQEDNSWVILNRNYKPIGINTAEFIDYREFPVSATPRSLTTTTLKKLSYDGTAEDKIYLYNDDTNPLASQKNMESYLTKLAILTKIQLKT